MSKREKLAKWYAAYGHATTFISIAKLPVVDKLLMKYNNDIILRIKDPKMRKVLLHIDKKDFELMKMDIGNVVPLKKNTEADEQFRPTVRLYTEGMLIVTMNFKEDVVTKDEVKTKD